MSALLRELIGELSRRNVFRALAIYAGGAWLLVQIATQVFPFFDVPNWAVRWVVVAALLGLPIVLLLSWFYELTPEGLKRESEVDHDAEATRSGARWIDRRIVVVAGVMLVLLGAAFVLRRATSIPGARQQSIAIMPFKSLSDVADSAYFANGIQDEILTRLAKIASLKVISRTSTAYYASQPADLRKIAQELGVSHFVEGSVQRHGDSARIAVQLIAADSDANLWAETYDRKLDDIFGVESEVAKAIANALQAKLTGAQQQELASTPTQNPQAYDAYLRGIAFDLRTFEPSYLASAASWLSKAVELDPDFALAWARLARVDANRAYYGFDLAQRPCERARNALDAASRLKPELGETDLARGYVRFMCDDDLKAAEQAFGSARARLPNSADVLRARSQIEWRKGNLLSVLADLHDAVELDPRNPELLASYALYLGVDRQFAEARTVADRALNINPDDAALTALQALIDQAEGDLDAAQKKLDGLGLRPAATDVFVPQMLQLLYRGQYKQAIASLNAALAGELSGVGVGIADYYALLATAERATGNADAARQAFRRNQEALKVHDNVGLSDLSSGGYYLRAMLCFSAVGLDASALDGADCKRLQNIAASDSQFSLDALESLARVYVLAGKNDAALTAISGLLGKSYTSALYTVPLTAALLRQDPLWAPLRTDPRFQKLVAK